MKRKKKIEKKEQERLRLICDQERIARELEELSNKKKEQYESVKSIRKVLTLVIDMAKCKNEPDGRAEDSVNQIFIEEVKERKVAVERKHDSQFQEQKLLQQ